MFKRTLTHTDIFLIAANLLAVFGVWFLECNSKQVFVAYWLETIIIGFLIFVKFERVTNKAIADFKKTSGKQ